jgi:hypothetical protein
MDNWKKIVVGATILVIIAGSYILFSPIKESGEKVEESQQQVDVPKKEEDTIVEGHGWKNIVLGATKDNIVNAVGEPSEVLNYSDVYFYNYYPLGIQINFNRVLNTTKAIFFYNNEADSKQFSAFTKRANKGVGFDSLADDVIQKYGEPQNDHTGNDKGIDWRRIEYSNIDFRFENSKMVRISVQ